MAGNIVIGNYHYFEIYNCIIKALKRHIIYIAILYNNPLSPHDALKHHYTVIRKESILPQLMDLEGKFP